ncbi:MAG: hypothetical protein ACFFDN_05750 [Candidatus Hodarchaeota archaeon]
MLRSDTDDEIKRLVPTLIPKELPNIVYIEGPNSVGKSTLLNILSLGLYGLYDNKINNSLRVQMKDLMNKKIQKMTFNFEIYNSDKSVVLKVNKNDFDNTEILLEESLDGKPFKPLAVDKFNKKYNLIYDIPINQRERLYDLLDELKYEQNKFGNDIKLIYEYIRKMIVDIENYRNPERIKQLKKSISDLNNRNKEICRNIPIKEEILNILESYYSVRMYCHFLNECDRLKNKIQEITEKKESLFDEQKKISKKQLTAKKNIQKNLEYINKLKDEIYPILINILFKNNKHKMQAWRDVALWDTSKYIIDKRLKAQIIRYIDECDSEIRKIELNPSFENAHILRKIIEYLEIYKKYNIKISQLGIYFNQLVEILKEESSMNEEILTNHSNYTNIRNKLNDIKNVIDKTNSLLSDLKGIELSEIGISKDIIEIEDDLEDIDTYKNLYKENEKNLKFYTVQCQDKNIDVESEKISDILFSFNDIKHLQPYYSLKEDELKHKITENIKNIKDDKDEVKRNEILLETYNEDLNNLKNKKPHKYESQLKSLKKLLQILPSISGKISIEYPKMLNKIIENRTRLEYKSLNEDEIKYYHAVGKYLANRIGKFYYIEGEYNSKNVDLIDNIIYTEEGLRVPINLLGTGHGQAAYLSGLLNTQDSRLIIALFDEISSMDIFTLEPIFKKIKDMYLSRKLLSGILVQKLDKKEVNIKNLEEH